ncbi:MAG TPA: fused MFS/spermidine synthase, partial [Patescibacteria group bacterium]|nr:fused MFS/spermidine synthase [Patescibacteria group bacterium]
MFKYSLELVVFICGAAVMILEMVGSRMMAPYLGTSIIVWTSLIGIILGFLSLGYWLGGKLADIKPSYRIFSLVILLSSLFVLLMIFIQAPILELIQSLFSNIYLGTVFSALFLFAIPSTLLGIVSPYAARLKIKSLDRSGEAVGSLYALSTLGSIVGTFAAGFVLIPFMGTVKILYFISISLLASSLLAYSGHLLKFKIAAITLILLFSFFPYSQFGNKVVADIDSRYSRILLEKDTHSKTREPILKLSTGPFGDQSAMFLDEDKRGELVFKYSEFYSLADYFQKDLDHSLVLG